MSARTSPVIAFAVAAAGIAIYSVMDTLMKRLSIDSGAYSAVLWRSWVGVAIMALLFLAKGGRWPGRHALTLHIARGATGGISVVLFFWGLARVPMAQVRALPVPWVQARERAPRRRRPGQPEGRSGAG